MNESLLASEIASKVLAETQFWIAVMGLIGVVIGSILTIIGNLVLHWLREKPKNELDKSRVAMLKEMLDDDRFPEKWRHINVLSTVIGTSEEETKRLLFIAGARGSEKADGKWGLVKNHPFPGPK